LDCDALAQAHAAALIAQLPGDGALRLALDWTSEETQYLLVASLRVGRRAVPLYWRAYQSTELKEQMSRYEREFLRLLFQEVLATVAHRRFLLSADRWFADVDLLDLLDELGVSYVICTKSSYKVRIDNEWRRLSSLRFCGNHRRRAWGRVWYTQGDPRRVYLVQARARDAKGKWGIWHLISNRQRSAHCAVREYALRFTCEEGFRDCKRLVGFHQARIICLKAWSRMFALVAVALVVLYGIGIQLLARSDGQHILCRVRSRRRRRTELSLVRVIVELLANKRSLWKLLDHQAKLKLANVSRLQL
jgi:Transposase DDE domain